MVKFKLVAEGREIIFPTLTHLPRKHEQVILAVRPSNVPTVYMVDKVTHIIEDHLASGRPAESWEIELV